MHNMTNGTAFDQLAVIARTTTLFILDKRAAVTLFRLVLLFKRRRYMLVTQHPLTSSLSASVFAHISSIVAFDGVSRLVSVLFAFTGVLSVSPLANSVSYRSAAPQPANFVPVLHMG